MRAGPQLLQSDSRRCKLVAVGRIDVAVPEEFSEAEPACEIEYDAGVGTRLAAWRHDRLSKLHPRLCLRSDVETHLQSLVLEWRGGRQNEIRHLGRGIHEQVCMRVERQGGERPASETNVGMRQHQIGAKSE